MVMSLKDFVAEYPVDRALIEEHKQRMLDEVHKQRMLDEVQAYALDEAHTGER